MNTINNIEFRKNILDSIKKFEEKSGIKKSILLDENQSSNKYVFNEKKTFQYYNKKK